MNKILKRGISHRVLHQCLLIIILIFSGTVIYSTFKLTNTFMEITTASRLNNELQKAAQELLTASDYLSEQVQRFTINGDARFMDQYFTEAFESKRREQAISKMRLDGASDAALEQLNEALDNSLKLMDQEYYAMKLVIEAKGYTDYPEVLRSVKLTAEDAALSSDDKIRRATELVLNDDYYAQKDKVRQDMEESLIEVDKLAESTEELELLALKHDMLVARVAILVQALLIFSLLWLITRITIDPLMDAVDSIKADQPVSETGSNEFIYFANAYNKMYHRNKSSLEKLNYKASHDELTGAYNRVGYDLELETIDLNSTHMLLFDVDNFKNINDTYGHETGDKVLVKLVNILKSTFRDDDCICRIGGDEFVVFMVHSTGMQRSLIESKIERINKDLETTDDGLPPISISVGIMDGKDAADTTSLFEKTDEAMYESKKHGKHTYTFYHE